MMVTLLCCRMGTIFRSLGLTVGVALRYSVEPETQAAFDADITYVTASDLAFTYLSDNTNVECLEQLARTLWPCLSMTTLSCVWCHVAQSMPVLDASYDRLETTHPTAQGGGGVSCQSTCSV